MICMPIDGFQVTEVTKTTRVTNTDLWPRVPEGISVRAFFISSYQPSFSSPAFRSDLPTTCRERRDSHVKKRTVSGDLLREKAHRWAQLLTKISPFVHLASKPCSPLARSQSQVRLRFQNDQLHTWYHTAAKWKHQPNWKMGKRPEYIALNQIERAISTWKIDHHH